MHQFKRVIYRVVPNMFVCDKCNLLVTVDIAAVKPTGKCPNPDCTGELRQCLEEEQDDEKEP